MERDQKNLIDDLKRNGQSMTADRVATLSGVGLAYLYIANTGPRDMTRCGRVLGKGRQASGKRSWRYGVREPRARRD